MRMNSQGLGMALTGTSISVGPSRRAKACRKRLAQFVRALGAHGRGAKAFGKFDEIRIGEVARDQPVAVTLLLDTTHIAEGAVIEKHRHQRNAVAHGGRHFRRREQEAAIAGDRQHRHVAPRVLRAERGGEAIAQIVLIAGREKGARLINRKGEAGREAKLRHLIDENAVVRQRRTDRRKIRKLRHELGEALLHAGMALAHLVRTRRPAGIVRRQDVEQAAQYRRGVPDQRDLGFGDARRLVRVGIDTDNGQIAIDAPLQQRHVQMGADAKDDIGLGPQFAAERQVDRKRIAIAQDAAAPAIGEDRRLQQMRQPRHLGRSVLARRRRRRSAAVWRRRGASRQL